MAASIDPDELMLVEQSLGLTHACSSMCFQTALLLSPEECFTIALKNFPKLSRHMKVGEFIASERFPVYGSPNLRWGVVVYPRGSSEQFRDFIGFYLRFDDISGASSSFTEKLWVRADYCVKSPQGQLVVQKGSDVISVAANAATGFGNFLKRKDVLKNRNLFLGRKKTLRLTIEIQVISCLARYSGNSTSLKNQMTRSLHVERCWTIVNFKHLPGNCDPEPSSWKSPPFFTGTEYGDNDEIAMWKLVVLPSGGIPKDHISASLRLISCGSRAEIWATFAFGLIDGKTGKLSHWVNTNHPCKFTPGIEWSYQDVIPDWCLHIDGKPGVLQHRDLQILCHVTIVESPGSSTPYQQAVNNDEDFEEEDDNMIQEADCNSTTNN